MGIRLTPGGFHLSRQSIWRTFHSHRLFVYVLSEMSWSILGVCRLYHSLLRSLLWGTVAIWCETTLISPRSILNIMYTCSYCVWCRTVPLIKVCQVYIATKYNMWTSAICIYFNKFNIEDGNSQPTNCCSVDWYPRGSNKRVKSGGLAWKQGGMSIMWENVDEFPKTKRRKYPQYTSEWGYVIMRKSNRPFIPANDYSDFISL